MKGREFSDLSNKVIGCAIEVHKTHVVIQKFLQALHAKLHGPNNKKTT